MPKKNEKKPKNPKRKAKAKSSNTFYGLTAAWLFYEGAGEVLHDSYGTLDLTLLPGSGFWMAGAGGRGFDPNGSGYALHVDDARLDVGANQDFTFVVGLQMPSSIPADERAIFCKRPADGLGIFGAGYDAIVNNTTGSIGLAIEEAGGAGQDIGTGVDQCDGKFHIWAMGRSGSDLFLIKDGVETWTQSGAPTGDLSNTDELYISFLDFYGDQYQEPIYFVYFYRGRALDAQAIRTVAISPFAEFIQPPIVQSLVGAEAIGGQDPVPASGSAGVYPVGVGMFIV